MTAKQNVTDLTETIEDVGKLPAVTTPKECAAIARVTETHIRDLCREGKIKARKVGALWRINTAEFLRYIGIAEVVA